MNTSESKIVLTPDDDLEMEAAGKLARKTFRFFWRELSWENRRIVPGLDIAAVKVAFSDPPEVRSDDPGALEVEHMWLNDVSFDGRQMSGTLLNSPHSLRSISEGDRVDFDPNRMNDWMYAINNRVYGGFTVNLMRSRMNSSQRKQHDNAWGMDFGDAENVFVVPPDFIGEKPAKSGGLFSMFSKPKVQPQDYEAAALIEHPMSENMGDSLDKALAENPSMLNETDDNGFAFLQQLSLAGSARGVDVVIKRGADIEMKTNNGQTALQLAKMFRWQKVVALLEAAG